jgi:hypothetical protein
LSPASKAESVARVRVVEMLIGSKLVSGVVGTFSTLLEHEIIAATAAIKVKSFFIVVLF